MLHYSITHTELCQTIKKKWELKYYYLIKNS